MFITPVVIRFLFENLTKVKKIKSNQNELMSLATEMKVHEPPL